MTQADQPHIKTVVEIAPERIIGLLGIGDANLRVLEELLDVDIHARGNRITLSGKPCGVTIADRVIAELLAVVGSGSLLTPDAVRRSVAMTVCKAPETPSQVLSLNIISRGGRTIRPKTLNQKRYVDAIDSNTIVFGCGPAGTGKTYLAMAKAVAALQAKEVARIILTRPAVEAGERLGFLPGTLSEKIDPYLRPLYDALHDMMEPELVPKLMAAGVIEVAPLAYMRGRAQPLSTQVLTPIGFKRIGDIKVGDKVIGSDGRPTKVQGVYPQGLKSIVRLTTQDGATTLCSDDHLWSVYKLDGRQGSKGLRVLAAKDMIGNLRLDHYYRYELPLISEPVSFPVREVPFDPYTLGLVLGDGCAAGSNNASSVTKNPKLAQYLEKGICGNRAGQAEYGNYVFSNLSSSGSVINIEDLVQDLICELGLFDCNEYTKFVPPDYLMNSTEVRLAVLQGLMDIGGSISRSSGKNLSVQYTAMSSELCEQVVFLVQSLGGVACCYKCSGQRWNSGNSHCNSGHYRNDPCVIDIQLPPSIVPFRLGKKAKIYGESEANKPERYIDTIETWGTEESVCIKVAAEDSLYVTEDFLLTHNTLNNSFIILDEAQNTTSEQMKMFLTRLGFGSKVVVTGDVTQVDLPGSAESGLKAVTRILEGLDGIHFTWLNSDDVVRNRLVADIVDAYARAENSDSNRSDCCTGRERQR